MDCYILVVILWEGLGGFAGQGVGLVYYILFIFALRSLLGNITMIAMIIS